jgi:RHS repeat-associated protein
VEKERKEKKTTPDFLRNDRGKTKSNAIEMPSINLPKGGGAIKGIDEKFSVNAVNGTASFLVPLPLSPARGATPSLGLSYNSGSGNGVFGLGWSLNLPSIKRKTDKQLPQYQDAFDSDTFLFSEAEDLVPEFTKENDGSFSLDPNSDYIVREEDSPDGNFRIMYFRPRIEGLFARIERWQHKTTSELKWRVITKENLTTLFGWTVNARIFDPKDNKRTFQWLPEFSFDDKGNCIKYVYKREDDKGFAPSLLHNRNRVSGGNITYTNVYLKTVMYGNKTPYKHFGDPFNADADFLFQVTFDYGEHESAAPCAPIKDWDFRPDAFSEYKSGFEIRTTRLCRRVLLYHFLDELPGGSALVRSVDLNFDTSTQRDFTFLTSFVSTGYIKKADGTYTKKSLPPFEFTYQKHDWSKEVRTIAADEIVHSPSGMADSAYQFTDLFNEGLSGLLTEQATGWFYKHNLGNGKFARAKMLSPKPSFAGLGGGFQIEDLNANGQKQLVNYANEPKGYFEINDDDEWAPFRTFNGLPNIDLGGPNTRMLDLDGDGMADVLITEENVFSWHKSEGTKGFASARKTVKPFDEETGPHMLFSDLTQSIFLADMKGDGLTDIVRIRNGEVCYWPNLGYGRFGAKVAMDDAPVFDHSGSFDPSRIQIADIDGSGTADVIYLGKNKFTCWMNLSGNSFTDQVFEIESFPEIFNRSNVTVTDLLGNGVACIVWSSDLSKHSLAPLRYVDLMNSKKPHLMTGYKNNLGKEVSLQYAPSTKFYLEDKNAGRPWITKLHFPIHCLDQTETRDAVSGYRFVTSYKYHHGYFDHAEREFRGFGMVEQIDSEHFEHWIRGGGSNVVDAELHQPPVLTRSWFHTGAFLRKDIILGQYAEEYWYEELQRKGFPVAHLESSLPEARLITAPGIDPALIAELSPQEWREAFRACKSMGLRVETFAKDAPLIGATADQTKKEMTPFTVATHNCVIELLQPKGKNKHAVFTVKESESISYSYERDPVDPRISHNLNLKLDEYGNILESASVVYPRMLPDAALPVETQAAQNTTHIIYTENKFTNDISSANDHRLRLPSEVKTYELKGVAKAGTIHSLVDFTNILGASANVEYHNFDRNPPSGSPEKRLVEHVRTIFYDDNLSSPLPVRQLSRRGITFESYQLAYTLPLLTDIFGTKVIAALMLEGKFTHSEGDDDWWIRSGTVQYVSAGETLSDAEDRFIMPVSHTDPYGSITRVSYFSDYFLFVEEIEDALSNKSRVLAFNMRSLAPRRVRDVNGNISEAISDELGFLKAIAIFGKGAEADDLTGLSEFSTPADETAIGNFFAAVSPDQVTAAGKALLNHATSRFVYDLDAYRNSGGKEPAVVSSILREEHFQKVPNSPVHISFEYSNGLGQVVMKKAQAEPGEAKQVTVDPDDTYTVADVDTAAAVPPQIRWIGNGRTVLNNKGNPVKQYEPYFSTSHKYEDQKELVETGVTPVIYYDALGRVIKTEFSDATSARTEFDSWKHRVFDQNDTILESPWHTNRVGHLIDAELIAQGKDPAREKLSAEKAAKHADTPTVLHTDTLGRPVLQIEHNRDLLGSDVFYQTKKILDIEGNLRSATDARGNVVVAYKYDILGSPRHQQSMDAGQRWTLQNILGQPQRTWDERNHEFQFYYDDPLHRATHSKVVGGDGALPLDNIFDRTIYGESLLLPGRTNEAALQAKNILGKPIRLYDTGGLLETEEYDFKGQPVATTRRLFGKYKEVCNWTDANLAVDLETDDFTYRTETDALGRATSQIAPDGSVITPAYNEAGLLNSETVLHPGAAAATPYIKNIDYNEKGLRERITYGNDVFTKFFYDKETFRLNRLESKRQNNDPVQDWHYTYDPAGNITFIEDKNVPVVFFDNAKIIGLCEYTYDALYRLIQASGRENDAALTFGAQDNWDDAPYLRPTNPGDGMAIRNYTQDYEYDSVGNILRMRHQATGNNWTRDYTYQASNNRLVNTQVGSQTYSYPHHPQHGFITAMPHLEDIGWTFKEEVTKTVRQRRTDGGTPETTYYQYDGGGQRIRKITENTANPGVTPTRKEERIYVAGYELFKQHSGANAGLERESLSLMDQGHRFVMVEIRNDVDDGTEKQLTRYQMHNHLGSAALELDTNAAVISYEEYHPYGTTAYQAKNTAIKSAAKRYRFSGMERDEESGLEYHSARYYLPWLGRWLSADPIGIKDGLNLFRYVSCNPIKRVDLSGTEELTIYHRTTAEGAKAMGEAGAKTNMNRPHVWGGGGFYGADTPSIPGSGARGDTIVAQKVKADKVVDLDQLKGGGKNLSAAMQDTAEGRKIRTEIYSQLNDQKDTSYRTKGRKPSDADVDKFFKDYMDKQLQKVAPNADVIKWKNPDGSVTFVVKKSSALVGTPTTVGKMVGGRYVPTPHVSTPHVKTPKVTTPDLPKTRAPKTPKGGIIFGVIVAVGVFAYTGDVYAAGQTANPLAETTDAVVEGGGPLDVVGGAALDVASLYPPVGIVRAGAALNRMAMDASHFPVPEGFVEARVAEGRNPFCAMCHGEGNLRERKPDFSMPSVFPEPNQALLDFINAQ